MLSSYLVAANGNLADGNTVVFAPQYSNGVDGSDAIKLTNPGENFGLLRNGSILAVEARQPIAAGDTIFFNMTHLSQQLYKLEIIPQYLTATTVKCELVDRYLNTRVPIVLNDSNHLSFAITADPASSAVNRLIIVFSNQATTTVTPPAATFAFTSSSATNNENKTVLVRWLVQNENSIERYEVQRSGVLATLLRLQRFL